MKKILVVEDQPDIRRLIRMTLEMEACEIHEAGDATTGWVMANRLKPEVALLDVTMPGDSDGLDLCLAIKIDPALAGVKVIMLSARGSPADRAAGVQAGADAYLVKPFSPRQLLALVHGAPAHA